MLEMFIRNCRKQILLYACVKHLIKIIDVKKWTGQGARQYPVGMTVYDYEETH